ncbi:DUF5691 domain-containing protein [Bradyrhizobium sp.]|uniref:DUF5691 domain-containing protein n=1 Tax=Bradyrhizobium sp. TaxID=376 RepID=UPI003C36FAEF
MHELEASLARIRSAWMAGRSALEHCPAEWREVVEGEHGEAALAALTGHATSVLFRTAPGSALEARPLLPALALPVMAEALRPRFRRILSAQRAGTSIERPLIDLVTARGVCVHPADWMPSPRDDWAPDIYAPWLDWVRTESKAKDANAALTIESYQHWPWAERRAALAQLRRTDPAAALAIVAAKGATEPAERRLRLLEILETSLSEADAGFLESLANDRSERVQAIARAYLARLGRSADSGDLAAELAGMVELGKVGLINRRSRLVIKSLKTAAQKTRRNELFRLVSLAALARALGVADTQLMEAPPEGPADTIDGFAQMVATTGSDAARTALLDCLLADAASPLRHLCALAPRLSAGERRALTAQIMARDDGELDTTLSIAGRELGLVPLSAMLTAAAYKSLKELVEDALNGPDGRRTHDNTMLGMALNRIALLLDAPGAADLAARVVDWGLSAADPRLDLLHLNAALKTETIA